MADFLEYENDKDELYDTVVLRHVLEHLVDPILSMEKIHSFLKPSGYGVLEFPNIESLYMRVQRFILKTRLHKKNYREVIRRAIVMNFAGNHLPIF